MKTYDIQHSPQGQVNLVEKDIVSADVKDRVQFLKGEGTPNGLFPENGTFYIDTKNTNGAYEWLYIGNRWICIQGDIQVNLEKFCIPQVEPVGTEINFSRSGNAVRVQANIVAKDVIPNGTNILNDGALDPGFMPGRYYVNFTADIFDSNTMQYLRSAKGNCSYGNIHIFTDVAAGESAVFDAVYFIPFVNDNWPGTSNMGGGLRQ